MELSRPARRTPRPDMPEGPPAPQTVTGGVEKGLAEFGTSSARCSLTLGEHKAPLQPFLLARGFRGRPFDRPTFYTSWKGRNKFGSGRRGAYRGGRSAPRYLATVSRLKPVGRVIAWFDRPCWCRWRIWLHSSMFFKGCSLRGFGGHGGRWLEFRDSFWPEFHNALHLAAFVQHCRVALSLVGIDAYKHSTTSRLVGVGHAGRTRHTPDRGRTP